MRMEDLAEAAKLLLEAVQPQGVEFPERFQCNALVALSIEGLVDDAHAAGADLANDRETFGASKGTMIGSHAIAASLSTISGVAANITVQRSRRAGL